MVATALGVFLFNECKVKRDVTGSGGEFRRLLPATLEKTSFLLQLLPSRTFLYTRSKVAPHLSAPKQKSSWHRIGHGCFFAFYPASIPFSRVLHDFSPFLLVRFHIQATSRSIVTTTVSTAPSQPLAASRVFHRSSTPTLRFFWTLTARQFCSAILAHHATLSHLHGYSIISNSNHSKRRDVSRVSNFKGLEREIQRFQFEKLTEAWKISPALENDVGLRYPTGL